MPCFLTKKKSYSLSSKQKKRKRFYGWLTQVKRLLVKNKRLPVFFDPFSLFANNFFMSFFEAFSMTTNTKKACKVTMAGQKDFVQIFADKKNVFRMEEKKSCPGKKNFFFENRQKS